MKTSESALFFKINCAEVTNSLVHHDVAGRYVPVALFTSVVLQ
jgi:hypothetical protein